MDDERSLVELMERLLRLRGIPVCYVAYDGKEAVEEFERRNPRPHIVLMDYRMPSVTGLEATRQILAIDGETKVIFISADGSVKDEALKAGAVMFLQKPVSIKEIINAIEGVVKAYPDLKV